MAITKRSVKGSSLTWAEMDANWDELAGKSPIAGPGSSQAFAVGALTQTGTALLAQTGGNVGIGVAVPDKKLVVAGDFKLENATNMLIGANGSDYQIVTSSTASQRYFVNGTETLTIHGLTNNVGIGSVNDNGTGAKLQVNGTISASLPSYATDGSADAALPAGVLYRIGNQVYISN